MFKCHLCDNKYNSKMGLSVHLARTHNYQKPKQSAEFKCFLCENEYDTKRGLECHLGKIHHCKSQQIKKNHQCKLCDFSTDNLAGLGRHMGHTHNISREEAHLFHFNRAKPLCPCGCGLSPNFYSFKDGYMTYYSSHKERVNNSWGHNKKALEKSQETRKKMRENGEIKYWCAKENRHNYINSFEKMRNTCSQKASLPERKEIASINMTKNRLNGVIPTLYGENHPQWKGGTSGLQQICRSAVRNIWSFQIMKRDNFTCQDCNQGGSNLCVHHDNETFAEILQKAVNEFQFSSSEIKLFENKKQISNWVSSYHINNNVSGITLCCNCHDKRHGK